MTGSIGGSTTRTDGEHAATAGPFIRSVRSWLKGSDGGQKRHKHLATILRAARCVVTCVTIMLISTIVFVTNAPGILRTIAVFAIYITLSWAGLFLLQYYRTAIFGGAMRKKGGTGTTAAGGTISNTSVVPAPPSQLEPTIK